MFVNLTPHDIHIYKNSEYVGKFAASGAVARSTEHTDPVAVIGEVGGVGVLLVRTRYGNVIDLPDPSDGVMYIVSHLVRMACPERMDLCSPGGMIRDENGRILGCCHFIVNDPPDPTPVHVDMHDEAQWDEMREEIRREILREMSEQ